LQDADGLQRGDAGVLRLGERLRVAVAAVLEAVLLEPRQRPARVRVEIALLGAQHFIQGLVDERERLAHRDGFAGGVDDLRVAGVDGHAGADGGLG